MKKKLERQANQLATLLRNLGHSEEEIAQRIQNALAARSRNKSKGVKPPSAKRFEGCTSVTATANRLGIHRVALFARLRDEGWLYRTTDGWRATDEGLAAGWAVMRGSRAIQWPQLTQAGAHEIAHRLGLAD